MDEIIAVIVAFAAIGSVLAWGLTRTSGFTLDLPTASANLPETPAPEDATVDARLARGEASPTGSDPVEPPAFDRFSGATSPETDRSASPATTGATGEGAGLGGTRPAGDTATQTLTVPHPEAPVLESSTALTTPLAPPIVFADVSPDYWAKGFIDGLTARKRLAGFPDNTFQPDKPLTRAELATQIVNVFPLQPTQAALPFKDVPIDFWAANTINLAVQSNFMRGYPEQVFEPNQTVPRVQVMAAIASGLNLQPITDPTLTLQRFADQDQIPPWARAQVAAAVEAGLVINYPDLGQLRPNEAASRAEVAAMMYRTLVYLGEVEDVPSAYVVQP